MNGVYDEHGVRWEVKPRDPASRAVNRLRKAGFRYIVLPRLYIRTGDMVEYADTLSSPDSVPPLVHEARLKDCLRVLEA